MITERLHSFLERPDRRDGRQVIYITGLAGSGKTTQVHVLAERLGAHTIPEFLEPMPDWVLNTRIDSPIERKTDAQLWVLGQYAQKNELIGRQEGRVVVDRTWPDALTYASIYGPETLREVIRTAEKIKWKSGLFIALLADPEVIKVRLMAKFGLSEGQWRDSWKSYIKELRAAVLQLVTVSGILSIDTSSQEVGETADIIEREFESCFRGK